MVFISHVPEIYEWTKGWRICPPCTEWFQETSGISEIGVDSWAAVEKILGLEQPLPSSTGPSVFPGSGELEKVGTKE